MATHRSVISAHLEISNDPYLELCIVHEACYLYSFFGYTVIFELNSQEY